MNFIKRAWLATKSKLGRSLLLTLVTIAILLFVLAGITIKNAANAAVKSAKNQTGSTISLQLKREYMMSQMAPPDQSSSSSSSSQKTVSIPLSVAKKLANNSGIASYLFTTTTQASAGSNISPISTSSSTSSSSSSDSQSSNGMKNGGPQMASGDFTITGVSSTAKVSDFTSSTSKISKGVGITSSTANNSAVISSDLAKKNSLSVGDSFTIKTTVNGTEKSVTLKVVGIYTSSATANSAQMQSNSSNPQNNIYTNVSTVNTLKSSSGLDSAVFTVSNPSKLSSLVKEMKTKINTKKYSLTSSDEVYKQMLQPLNNISSIANNIIILVAVAGAIILTLIIMLSIRERRYEIGVLMSLGENRLKIIGQFFTELAVVTLISLCLASLAGGMVGNALGNQLLSNSTSQQVSQKDNNVKTNQKS